jgi:hypothetical protein
MRIAIIGGGPIGLEAALYARRLGHECVVFERGLVAQNVSQWGFVSLFSPWAMNTTPLGWKAINADRLQDPPSPKICPTGNEFRDRYLLPLASSRQLQDAIRVNTTVRRIARKNGRFEITLHDASNAERIEQADAVLDCSGTYQRHRWAGRGGLPATGERDAESRIWYQLPDVIGRDRERFIGKHTLVLGAGYSAATVLLGLEALHRENSKTRASWAIRRIGQAMQALHNDPLPARASLVKHSIEVANNPPSWLQYLGNCVLERIDAEKQIAVTLKYMETDLALVVDEVVALVGYGPEQLLESWAPAPPAAADGLLNPEPNLFILGAKSFGTNSNFLLAVGHRQIRDTFHILTGDQNLDLYA